MFDKKIELKVLDSGKKIRESIVGLFLVSYHWPQYIVLYLEFINVYIMNYDLHNVFFFTYYNYTD